MEPQHRFCRSADGTEIGYVRIGEGPPIVALNPSIGNFEAMWAHSGGKDWIRGLAQGRTYVSFDRRGAGLSQRDVDDLSLEAELADLEAVLEAEGIDRFDADAALDACEIFVAFAARNPGRIHRLILFMPYARYDFRSLEPVKALREMMVTGGWSVARRSVANAVMPSGPPESVRLLAQTMKASMSPETYASYLQRETSVDMTDALSQINAPVLILHRKDSRLVPTAAVRSVASRLRSAELILLNGDAASAWIDPEQLLGPIHEFLGVRADTKPGARAAASSVATVLFTDLVGHTEMMARLGDAKGREVLREHERITREVLAAHGGTEVKTMGDGFLASFGSVTRAVECAIALQKGFADHEGERLSVRVGLNAGEPIEEEGDLFGATVILASRIAGRADGGEILVADTVRGLCSGKGFLFSDRGEFVAKGFQEAMRVYEVRWGSES